MNDPILEELRQIRDEHSRGFNYNLSAICEDYRSHQTLFSSRLVRLPPKIARPRLKPADSAASEVPTL
ncbi:hypothetical protein [Thiorhodovibrio winogradskyi]|uniref:hypothetical protein n=1 Tax=Thiorhodovibrio winogradskyi TaxID=77007 RepID=UPI002E2CC3E7|nr:hypothetical protein [Thiorhodovibrio winogradskyi]